MKVKFLKSQLEKMNPEADVIIGTRDGEPVLFVTLDDNAVLLKRKSDVDLRFELEVRWKIAVEEQEDELDFYMNLLEMGVTVDMVRKYMGDKKADIMHMFCEEHGLI